jgi:hypothetical protein
MQGKFNTLSAVLPFLHRGEYNSANNLEDDFQVCVPPGPCNDTDAPAAAAFSQPACGITVSQPDPSVYVIHQCMKEPAVHRQSIGGATL